MTFKDAAYELLKREHRPMKAKELTDWAMRKQMLTTAGKTPAATMGAQLYTDVKERGNESRFVQLGKNLWGLREWDLSVLARDIEREQKAKQQEHQQERARLRRSIVGDPISVEGLTYAPLNESGVIFLFAKLAPKLGYVVEAIQPAFPDAKARRKTSRGWVDVWIEFEYRASAFRTHGHDPSECDVVVCWENDWPDAPVEVLALKDVVR